MLVGLDLPSAGGGPEARVPSPHWEVVLDRKETFKAKSETADLWRPKWNENQTVLTTAIHTPDRDVDPQGLWSSPRVRAAVDCREGIFWRRLWWEMPMEESWAATEARRYC